MDIKAGLWIDQQRALIVTTADTGEKHLEILSQAGSPPVREPGISATAPFQVPVARPYNLREREYQGRLNAFFTQVIQAIREAQAIFIFGPGEAKETLCKHLVRARLGDKVASMESAGTMSDLQIVAKARDCFHLVAGH